MSTPKHDLDVSRVTTALYRVATIAGPSHYADLLRTLADVLLDQPDISGVRLAAMAADSMEHVTDCGGAGCELCEALDALPWLTPPNPKEHP